jgi:hypothetical protein
MLKNVEQVALDRDQNPSLNRTGTLHAIRARDAGSNQSTHGADDVAIAATVPPADIFQQSQIVEENSASRPVVNTMHSVDLCI